MVTTVKTRYNEMVYNEMVYNEMVYNEILFVTNQLKQPNMEVTY